MDQVLPNQSELERRYQSGLMGLLMATAAGMFVAMTAITMLAGVGYLLHIHTDMSILQLGAVMAAVLLIVAVGLFALAKSMFKYAFNASEKKGSLSTEIEDTIKEIYKGFMEGVSEKETDTLKKEPESSLHREAA
ncbi:MAG: hypothetical protein ACN2B6_10800 [Rickettsiales bacterium]